MTQIADPLPSTPAKKRIIPVLLVGVLALAGGVGGFFVMRDPARFMPNFSGLGHHETPYAAAYVALDPVVVNLPRASGRQMLRFTANLEVDPLYQAEVTLIRPRILDVLNGYLRAVDPADLEQQAILVQLRGQLLRRVQVVAGEGRVRDLLITEFVLN